MGVVSAEEGIFHLILPCNDIGGNIDCRCIGQGATLYRLVNVPGALLAVIDGLIGARRWRDLWGCD